MSRLMGMIHHLTVMKTHGNPKGGKRGKKKRPSAAQLHSRSALADTSYGWSELTEEERLTWDVAGKEERTHSRGRVRRLSGQKYYMKINSARAFLGLPRLRLPPAHSRLRPNPVGALSIVEIHGRTKILLSVPSAPAEHTKVLGSPPQNPGRRFCADYRFLDLLPPPKGGVSDITEPYVKKYGNPPPGSRVFIQTRQHLDGHQDHPKQTNAIVPGTWKRRRATGARG